jgi:DNA-binding MarR family transcriptional regulator
MDYLARLTNQLDVLSDEYDLDVVDLKILMVLASCWKHEVKIRVTDITHGGKIASPATLQNRINHKLVNAGLIELQPNPEDAREKLIVKGPHYERFEDFLNDLYMKGRV